MKLNEPYKLTVAPIENRLAEFPTIYTVPFSFGHGETGKNYSFNSGSATLINLGNGPFIATCHHVMSHYESLRSKITDLTGLELFIGNAQIEPDREFTAYSESLDIATMKLTDKEVKTIKKWRRPYPSRTVKSLYKGLINIGDLIVLAGYPSQNHWRNRDEATNRTGYHPCGITGGTVASINNDYIICQLDDLSTWKRVNQEFGLENDPTGMSGGPAFIVEHLPHGKKCHFVGIVTAGKFIVDDCLTIYISLAKNINPDGTLQESD